MLEQEGYLIERKTHHFLLQFLTLLHAFLSTTFTVALPPRRPSKTLHFSSCITLFCWVHWGMHRQHSSRVEMMMWKPDVQLLYCISFPWDYRTVHRQVLCGYTEKAWYGFLMIYKCRKHIKFNWSKRLCASSQIPPMRAEIIHEFSDFLTICAQAICKKMKEITELIIQAGGIRSKWKICRHLSVKVDLCSAIYRLTWVKTWS